jgi:hypothetical protein
MDDGNKDVVQAIGGTSGGCISRRRNLLHGEEKIGSPY